MRKEERHIVEERDTRRKGHTHEGRTEIKEKRDE